MFIHRFDTMASQENISKQAEKMEQLIAQFLLNERQQSIANDYTHILLQEKKIEESDEKLIQLIQKQHRDVEPHLLESRYLDFKAKVQLYEKRLEELRDEIDNVIIKAIGDKELMKIEQAEKERKMRAFYASETTTALQALDTLNAECTSTEQAIRNQIAIEAKTRNARLNEIKINLQRQIMERNAEYFMEQNNSNDLWKKLDNLKAQVEKSKKPNSNRSNVMMFENNHLDLANQKTTVNTLEIACISKTTNASEQNPIITTRSTFCSKEIEVPATDISKVVQEKSGFQDDYAQFEIAFFNDPTIARQNLRPPSCFSKNKAEFCPEKHLPAETPKSALISEKSLRKPNASSGENKEISDHWKFLECDTDENNTMNQTSNTCRKLPKIYRGKSKSKWCHKNY